MANATTPKRSPGTATVRRGETEFDRAPAVSWTDKERQLVLAAGLAIKRKNPKVNGRDILAEAMHAVLPPEKYRDPRKWAFKRVQWFLDALDKGKEEPKVYPAAKTSRKLITWTEDERALLIVAGREIKRNNPDMSVRSVLMRAQEQVLPRERWRSTIGDVPPHQLEWFTTFMRPETLHELPPVVTPELVELPPEKAPLRRTKKVFWTPHEIDQILARARVLRDTTGGDTLRSLINRAQRDILPPERWRNANTLGSGAPGQYLLRKMAEWPPAGYDRPIPTGADAEAVRLAFAEYAWPPAPAPEPIDVGKIVAEEVEKAVAETAAVGVVKAGTEDMLAELARRVYVSWTEWMGLVSSGFAALQNVQVAQNKDHELLLKLAAEWDPKLLSSPAPAPAVNGRHETPPAPATPAAKATPPKLKGILVGGTVEFGMDVINAVKEVIDLDFIAQGNQARNRGFKSYDCVFATPITGHDVTRRAKNELGHDNVAFIPQTSASRIAEEIRKWVSKREYRWTRAQVEVN